MRVDIVDLFDIMDTLYDAETKKEQNNIQDKIQAWRKSPQSHFNEAKRFWKFDYFPKKKSYQLVRVADLEIRPAVVN